MIWNGNLHDTTNFISKNYLQINSCGVQNADADYTVVRSNGRVDYHLLLIICGQCEATHNGKKYLLTHGDVIVYYPNEPHYYAFNEGAKSLWCHFSGTAAQEILQSAELYSGVYQTTKNDAVYDKFYFMIQQFHLSGREKFALPALIALIYAIKDSSTYSNSNKISEPISKALLYIQTNYNKTVTLEELAKISGYSKSRFSHLFAEETSSTPKSYQNNLRLNASREMLASTDKSIYEISFSCGFNDPFYFSRAFKQKYNLSPTQYRQQFTCDKNN